MSTTLKKLASRTGQLATRLRALIKQYPDDELGPDERIFNRLLTNDWRYLAGFNGPFNEPYYPAAAWVKGFDDYIRELTEYFAYGADQVQRLERLPLTGRLRIPSTEILRLLWIQRAMLTNWADAKNTTGESKGGGNKLRDRLRQEAKALGVDALAQAIGCSRDTLSDYLRGTTNPQEKTLQKFQSFVASR